MRKLYGTICSSNLWVTAAFVLMVFNVSQLQAQSGPAGKQFELTLKLAGQEFVVRIEKRDEPAAARIDPTISRAAAAAIGLM